MGGHEVITDAIKGPDGGSGGHPVDDYDQKTEERRGHCCSANYDYEEDYRKMEALL